MSRRFGPRGRASSFRKPRTKKIRPSVRIKERVAKKGGRCAACRARYEAGDEITVVNIRRRTYHRAGCLPANVGQMGTVAGPVGPMTPADMVKAMSTDWSVGEAKLVAMMALENALVVTAKHATAITPEMEKAFDKYNKLKGMFLRPGSENEGQMAAKFAVVEVVKTVF